MGKKKIGNSEYRKNLLERYGPEATDDFDAVFSGDINLHQISKKYKISKMWATKIFERLYGTTFRKAKAKGYVKDPDGKVHKFCEDNSKHILVILPPELHTQLKEYADKLGMSMSVVVRDCIIQLFNKDGLDRLSRFF